MNYIPTSNSISLKISSLQNRQFSHHITDDNQRSENQLNLEFQGAENIVTHYVALSTDIQNLRNFSNFSEITYLKLNNNLIENIDGIEKLKKIRFLGWSSF